MPDILRKAAGIVIRLEGQRLVKKRPGSDETAPRKDHFRNVRSAFVPDITDDERLVATRDENAAGVDPIYKSRHERMESSFRGIARHVLEEDSFAVKKRRRPRIGIVESADEAQIGRASCRERG